MQRREFITLVGGAAAALPIATRAEQPARLPTVGLLGSAPPSAAPEGAAAFVQRLSELRWVVGSTVAFEYRWAEGRNDRFAEFAAEFVRLKVDAIVTSGTPSVLALMQATSSIPIVFVAVGDPVANGLVKSLARPGGNVTGLSNQTRDLAGKRVEILREVIPGLRRLAILANVGNDAVVLEMRDAQAAARTLGYEVATLEIRRSDDIAPAFETLRDRADAIYIGDRRAGGHQPCQHQYPGAQRSIADHARLPGLGRSRRTDILWAELSRAMATVCGIHRQDIAGGQAC